MVAFSKSRLSLHYRLLLATACLTMSACVTPSAFTSSSTAIQDPQKRALWEKSVVADANLDANALAELWHPEGSVQIASNPRVTGRENVRQFFGGFFGLKLFKKLEHKMIEVWELPDATIYNATATYTLQDNSQVSLPYVNVVKCKDGLFFDYKVFIDASALRR
jgi:SnoaL-like domain